jgi:HKD family nuclease
MTEYIDSASQQNSDFIRHWLDKNLTSKTKLFFVQSGYFSYAGIEPFNQFLKGMIKSGGSVKFVLGSNNGSLQAQDANKVLKIVKGKAGCSFTIVSFKNAEFHPKCYYIKRSETSETAIVGSGNLTSLGIGLNIEAAIILDTDNGDSALLVQKIRDAISKWETLNESDGAYTIITTQDIKDLQQSKIIDLMRVEERVPSKKILQDQENKKKVLKKGLKQHWRLGKKPVIQSGGKKPTAPVLVAEIPNAGGRWKQANFDKDTFESFFGLTIGDKTKEIYLQSVTGIGSLSPIEARKGVSVKSQNYRLELAAASGLNYPTGNAPIVVFVRITSDTFRYRLLMPTDPEFLAVSTFLGKHWVGPVGRKRRITIDTKLLRKAWPSSPLWVKAGKLF